MPWRYGRWRGERIRRRRPEHDPEMWVPVLEKIMLKQKMDLSDHAYAAP
jgi:hypothetical protein